MTGVLYVVATPIGNLGDMTGRARQVLDAAHLIAAEDTRHSGRLLTHFNISTPMLSLHEQNESARVPGLVSRLRAGEDVALISDAGTPLISDPGFRLVAAAADAGIPVLAVPGPCAAVAALSVSGLPTDRFWFEGFLPARAAARRRRLAELATVAGSLVIYLSPHRLVRELGDLAEVFGSSRPAALCRELTKLHEETLRDTLAGLLALAESESRLSRGELVVVIAGAGREQGDEDERLAETMRRLLSCLSARDAAAALAAITGCGKNKAKRIARSLAGPDEGV